MPGGGYTCIYLDDHESALRPREMIQTGNQLQDLGKWYRLGISSKTWGNDTDWESALRPRRNDTDWESVLRPGEMVQTRNQL